MVNKEPRFGIISTLLSLLKSSANVMRSLLQLALLELDLAKRSFVIIIVLSLLMFIFLIASWCYALALLVYWLALQLPLIYALLIGLSINILILLVVLLLVLHYRHDLTFPATRRQVKKLKRFL